MKRQFILTCFAFAAAAVNCSGATADVRLHSLSARMQPGTANANALNYRLELTTGSPADSTRNGELAPVAGNPGGSHVAFYALTGDVLFEPVFGTLAVDLPHLTDSDTNGVPDFFEITRAVPTSTTTGVFEDTERSGNVTAVWSRAANSKAGTCNLTFDAYNLTFAHAFEVTEFAGLLNYSSTETNVTGSVSLAKQMEPARTLSGPLVLDKIDADTLRVRDGTWQNDSGLNLVFQVPEPLMRKQQRFTGDLFFRDGDPATPAEDYLFWVLTIIDASDNNGNSVPDISDEQAIVRQPVLGITPEGPNTVLIEISGVVGVTHQIEQTTSLGGDWSLAKSVVLETDPQSISVPVSPERPTFWRVRVR